MSKTISINKSSRHFAFAKEIPPVTTIQSGDHVIFETEDADVSLITKETDVYEEFSTLFDLGGGTNPVTGPVYVEGAEQGDCLAVELLSIQPGYWRGEGYTSLFAGLGLLQNTTGSLQPPLKARTKICKIEDGFVHFVSNDKKRTIQIPLNPCVGTIGVAPSRDRMGTENLGREFCGNIDLPPVKVGTTIILPVNVQGGLLSLGDVHACQGDGEITGCALECQAIVEVKVTLIKKEKSPCINWPQLIEQDSIGIIVAFGYADYTAAVQTGYTELVKVMEKSYGFDAMDAYQLLNLVGEVRIGNDFSCLCRIKNCFL